MKNIFKKNGKNARRVSPVWWSILKKQAKEFCLATGLHGYKYIVQTERSRTERIIWAIAVFISLTSAVVLMKIAWNHYASHPTLTVIESTHHGIWNYPFPAVTVCNINRISLNLTKVFVEKLKTPPNMSKEFLVEEMRLMNEMLMPGAFGYDVTDNLTRLQEVFDNNGLSIQQVVSSVTKNCSTLIEACKWRGESTSCHKLITQSISRDGLCCSFNYLSSSPNTKPKRTSSCGYKTGLTVLVNSEPHDFHASTLGTFGIKVLLHDPYDFPDYSAENKLAGLGVQVFLSITPEETYSTPEVKNLPISTRNCIFNGEEDEIGYAKSVQRNLTVARYSYLNCIIECRATIIRAKCSCIPYYYPQNGTRVCNLKDVQCLKKYKSWYETSWPGTRMYDDSVSDKELKIKERPCGCMPDCKLYTYPVESSQGFLDQDVYYSDYSFAQASSEGVKLENYSLVHVFFSDLVSIQYRRNVHYNWRNLFASFGGLLGLFAGFSLMSVFELIYFLVIRVAADLCIKRGKVSNT